MASRVYPSCYRSTYLCGTCVKGHHSAGLRAGHSSHTARASIIARAPRTATAEMATADAAVGVIAAQAAWLLFVVFSLMSPRAPGDESSDGSCAKGARGSGRSKWRRGRRRCLPSAAAPPSHGAEVSPPHADAGGGGQARGDEAPGEAARHRGAAAEDGVERRCGAAGEKRVAGQPQ